MLERTKQRKALIGVGALIALVLALQIITRATAMPGITESDVPEMEEECRAFGKEHGKEYQLLIGTLVDYKIAKIAMDFCMNTDPVCSAQRKAKVAALTMTMSGTNLHPGDQEVHVSYEDAGATLEAMRLENGQRYAVCAYREIYINLGTRLPSPTIYYNSDLSSKEIHHIAE